MSEFAINAKSEGNSTVYEVSGQIDEDAVFQLTFSESKSFVVDLEKVTAINSCGIREWIKWMRSAPSDVAIALKNCPKVVVDQINMVAGFLPENGKVTSFYVPYFCDETGSEKMVLFSEGKEFGGGEVNPPESVKDDDSGDEMEMDIIEAKYFKFLRG